VADQSAACNGVLFFVPPAEMDRLIYREEGYVPTRLEPDTIALLDGGPDLQDEVIWYYAVAEKRLPTKLHPIIQTYVDTCIGGCLEVEESSVAARAAGFARSFVETTDDWQPPWVNDRPLPWRSTLNQPRAWEIDTLLHELLGAELFGEIKVPGL
jgi:hypothetical protein